jgi:hypothetical protein
MESVLKVFVNIFNLEKIEKKKDNRNLVSYRDIDSAIQKMRNESIRLSLKSGMDPFRLF